MTSLAASPAVVPRSRSSEQPTVWLSVGIVGTMLNLLAYQSPGPLFVAGLLYAVTYAILWLTPLGGTEERRTFNACFATAWLAAGISATYIHFAMDPVQLDDAEDFYVLASDPHAGALGVVGLQALTSGAGAIVLWRKAYELFSALGLDRGRYVGIGINSLAISLNAVIAVKISREVFGSDPRRFRRLTILLACCGIYGLFASIHLRDAMVLITVTALTYFWVRYLKRAGWSSLVQLGAAMALAGVVLPLLRTEFFFVPVAMTLAGVVAIYAFDPRQSGRRGIVLVLLGVGVVMLAPLLLRYQDEIRFLLTTGHKNYAATSAAESGSGSLGNAIIMSAPFPLRLILGSGYLYVFPIPVWTGFQLKSAYYVFTSLTAIYFYFTVPLVIVALRRVSKERDLRTPALMFLVMLAIGFTVTIAGTSIETRHLGAFLVSFQTLALLPDLSVRADRIAYRGWVQLFIGAIAAVHLAWAILKFV